MRTAPFLLVAAAGCIEAPPAERCNDDRDCGRDICVLGFCAEGERAAAPSPEIPEHPGLPNTGDGTCIDEVATLDGLAIDARWLTVVEGDASVVADGAIRAQLVGPAESGAAYLQTNDVRTPLDDIEVTATVVDTPSGASAALAFVGLYSPADRMEIAANDISFTIGSTSGGAFASRDGEQRLRLRSGGGIVAVEAARAGGDFRVLHREALALGAGAVAFGAFAPSAIEESAAAAFSDVAVRTNCGCNVSFFDGFDRELDGAVWDLELASGVVAGNGALLIEAIAAPPVSEVGYAGVATRSALDVGGARAELALSQVAITGDSVAALALIDDNGNSVFAVWNQTAISAQYGDDLITSTFFDPSAQARVAIDVVDQSVVRIELGSPKEGLVKLAEIPLLAPIGPAYVGVYVIPPTEGDASTMIVDSVRVASSNCP